MKHFSERIKNHVNKPFVESFAERAGILNHRKASRRMLLYLSGAINSDPNALLKFNLAETILSDRGHIVINPFHIVKPSGVWGECLAEDLSVLTELGGYGKLLHGQLSVYLPTAFFPLPAVCILDDMPSNGRDLEKRFAELRGIPSVKAETLVENWNDILARAIEEQPK